MQHAPDDELLSAVLDGEATDAEVAHVDGCAECQTRLEVLRGVSRVVAATVAVPTQSFREAAVAVALHASDDKPDARMPSRRLNVLSAAAVLIVALAIGGLAIAQIGKGGRADSGRNADAASALAQSTLNDKSVAAPSADAATSGGAASDSTLSTESFAAVPFTYDAGDVGRFTALDDIVKLAQADLAKPDPDRAAHTTHAPSITCALPPDSTVLWEASLYYADTPVTAIVRTVSSSRWILELRSRDASDCAPLASRDFAPTTLR